MKKALSSLILIISASCLLQGQQTDPWWEEEGHNDHYWEEGIDSPESPSGITDGNPKSTTSIAASEAANQTAFITPDQVIEAFEAPAADDPAEPAASSAQESSEAAGSVQSSAIDIDVGFGSSTIDGVDVDMYTIRIPYARKISDRGTLNLSLPLSVTHLRDIILKDDGVSFGDASIYGGGLNVGYTHKVFMKKDGKPYRWNISPSAGIFIRDSSDLNQGAYVYNLGFSSSFAYRLDKNWVVNIGNSVSLAWNSGRKDYPDPLRDDQQVLINGVQVFYLAGRWTHYGYVMDTRFLRDSLVDNFQSYAIGTGFKLTRNRSIKFTLIYEDGSDYESLRGTLGSSWKF